MLTITYGPTRRRRLDGSIGGKIFSELARRENVSKLSGLVSEKDWTSWSEDDLRVYVNAVLAAFGPPVVRNGEHLINSLSATEKMPHLGGTAIDVYRLDD
jgi:hypothetical protein